MTERDSIEETALKTETTWSNFIKAIKSALEWRKFRNDQNKMGETIITLAFQVKLEMAIQWDLWVVKIESK